MPTTITLDLIRSLWPRGDSKVPGLLEAIAAAAPAVFAKYNFDTDLLVAHAFGQFSEECGAGTEMVENINYTAQRAVQVWPIRFANVTDVYVKIGSYPGDPDFPTKLIDSVYGGRMGNRLGTSDGSTFIGRGLSQVTGRDGYSALSAATGIDLLDNPAAVNIAANALECGIADFVLCGCYPFAAADDIIGVTKHLNGGLTGLPDRRMWTARWKTALASTAVVA